MADHDEGEEEAEEGEEEEEAEGEAEAEEGEGGEAARTPHDGTTEGKGGKGARGARGAKALYGGSKTCLAQLRRRLEAAGVDYEAMWTKVTS